MINRSKILGSVVLQIKYKNFTKEICSWIGAYTASAFVSREDKIHLLSILGCDASVLQNLVQKSRQQKAQKVRDAVMKSKEKNGEDQADESIEEEVEDEEQKQKKFKLLLC